MPAGPADADRLAGVGAPARRRRPVQLGALLGGVGRIEDHQVVALVGDPVQVVGVADPGRRGRLVQVDAIADLGEPAERVQDLLRLAEHLPEAALEVEREAADVGIRCGRGSTQVSVGMRIAVSVTVFPRSPR